MVPSLAATDTRSDKLDRLRRGRAFHALVQADWERNAKGTISRERVRKKPSGQRGFTDIPTTTGDEATGRGIKCTDWDRMSSQHVVRNAHRHIKQIWDYVESELADKNQPSPGIVFPTLPRDPDRRMLIESLFAENGITVVSYDQP